MALRFSDNAVTPRSQQMQGGAGAAGLASVAENFSTLRDTAPDYGGMERIRIQAESAKRQAALSANASVAANSIQNAGAVESARIQAEAAKAAAQKQAQGSMFGSIAKAGLSLVGSALLPGIG